MDSREDRRFRMARSFERGMHVRSLSAPAASGTVFYIHGLGESAVREARAEIAEYRRRRISAPRDSLWQKTVSEYDTAIEEREALIVDYASQLDQLHGSFAAELESLGLDVSREQLEFLLSTVVGDDLVEMGIAFHNVKTITTQLERLTRESGEDLVVARRYYGMYTRSSCGTWTKTTCPRLTPSPTGPGRSWRRPGPCKVGRSGVGTS